MAERETLVHGDLRIYTVRDADGRITVTISTGTEVIGDVKVVDGVAAEADPGVQDFADYVDDWCDGDISRAVTGFQSSGVRPARMDEILAGYRALL